MTGAALIPFPSVGGSHLVKFEEAKRAIAAAKSLPDVLLIKDRMAKLQALARIRDDKALEVDLAELHKECIIQIGRVSVALEKAKPQAGPGRGKTTSGRAVVVSSKAKALREAGIGKTQAAEAEELAGGKTAQGQAAATAAATVAFAKARKDQKPITTKGLRAAVRETLTATLGPPPKRRPKRKPKPDPTLDHLLALTGAIDTINELADDTSRCMVTVELVELSKSLGEIEAYLAAAESALIQLQGWRDALTAAHEQRSRLQ